MTDLDASHFFSVRQKKFPFFFVIPPPCLKLLKSLEGKQCGNLAAEVHVRFFISSGCSALLSGLTCIWKIFDVLLPTQQI